MKKIVIIIMVAFLCFSVFAQKIDVTKDVKRQLTAYAELFSKLSISKKRIDMMLHNINSVSKVDWLGLDTVQCSHFGIYVFSLLGPHSPTHLMIKRDCTGYLINMNQSFEDIMNTLNVYSEEIQLSDIENDLIKDNIRWFYKCNRNNQGGVVIKEVSDTVLLNY